MKFEKYKKSIQIFLIYAIIITIIGIVFAFLITGELSPLIPTSNFGTEMIIMFTILFPLSAIIGAFIGTYLLAPLFLFVHKYTVGRKCEYGVEERPEMEEFKKIFKGFFAALMAINFSLLIALNFDLTNILLIDEQNSSTPVVFIILLVITIGISTLLFAPIWSLLDSGIVYSNKKKLNDSDQPIEVRSVGGFYMYLLKGYAGIGVIITFYRFFTSLIFAELAENKASAGDIVSTSLVLIPFPFFITFAIIPGLIIFDITRKQRIFYVRKWARLFGIKDIFNIDLEVLKGAASDFKK